MTADFFSNQRFKLAAPVKRDAASEFVFTVDVEEWFQVGAFEHTFDRKQWPDLESRVEGQTEAILELLATLEIKATFFCLGWVAERFPGIVAKTVAAGHELACHGMDHRRLFTMTRDEFRSDIHKAKDLLEQAASSHVIGYRAPSFSLTPEVWWVYEELAEKGFRYSSSLYPVKTDHYGAGTAPRVPFFPVDRQDIIEIPMTVCDLPFRRIPASGGGYFRLLPYIVSRFLLTTGQRQAQCPGLFYMHPWELDLGQPIIRQAPWLSRFRHYTGQASLPAKLAKLSRQFNWGRMDEVFSHLILTSNEEV